MAKKPHVVVCGAGLSGLAAALSAQEHGASVTVHEKAPIPGGTTLLSGGLIWTFADYEELRARVPLGDGSLQWLVYETIDACRDWLAAQGAKLGAVENVLRHGRGQSIDPAQAIEAMAQRLVERGGTLRLKSALQSLVMRNGAIAGVRVLSDGVESEEPADAVVLATGGIQGNTELLARYVVGNPDNLNLRASPWSTGDGFLAATAAGAAASRALDRFYGHALAAEPARYTRRQLREASQYYGHFSVALNLRGERFADETDGTGEEGINQNLAQQPRGRGFYVVDEAAMTIDPAEGRGFIIRTIVNRAQSLGGVVIQADTLEALCAKLGEHGVPPARALATLTDYNAHLADNRCDDLTPPRRKNRLPLTTPPFYAVPVKAGITFVMGGLMIDERTRVLSRAGTISALDPMPEQRAYVPLEGSVVEIGTDYRQTAIAGLYAAGNDVGNVSHYGYVGGLATALTTGCAAGREAAGREP